MGTKLRLPKQKGDAQKRIPFVSRPEYPAVYYSNGTSSNATMLMILISGLMAGPAVSL